MPKSKTMQSFLINPGCISWSMIRRPRPIICTIVDLYEHGLVSTMQETGGASKPSVKTATFITTWTSPNSKLCKISARSLDGVSPVTISALILFAINSLSKAFAWRIVEQKTTVFLSEAFSNHSLTTRSLIMVRFIIASTCSMSKSLASCLTSFNSPCTPTSIT